MSKKNKISLVLLAISIFAFSLFFFLRRKETGKFHQLTYQTFETPKGWGYRIFAADTTLLIQQEMIPGIEGTNGFSTQDKAARTAALVIYKIKKGILPPTVEKKELDSLGVL